MRTFLEYALDKGYEDVKTIIFNIIDPDRSFDDNTMLSMSMDKLKNHEKLLQNSALQDILAKHKNRGAILAALKNSATTIGELLGLITNKKSEKSGSKDYLG